MMRHSTGGGVYNFLRLYSWQAGALGFNWKHGGSSALPFAWPRRSPPLADHDQALPV
jgi:hypothetical protein